MYSGSFARTKNYFGLSIKEQDEVWYYIHSTYLYSDTLLKIWDMMQKELSKYH